MQKAFMSQWPPTHDAPGANPGVRLIFTGMAIFTYKETNDSVEGRVVFHRGTANHILRILVLEDCRPIFAIGGAVKPIKIKEMEIGFVDGGGSTAFYQDINIDFDRANLKGNEKDFRWLLDLEGPDFHNGKFQRKTDHFRTKLNVKGGTFYTYRHTGHYFKCDGGLHPNKEVGYVPKVMACDISTKEGDCVYFRIDGDDVLPYPLCDGAKYEIYFFNECEKEDCDDHGDFPMVFDAVNIDPSEKFNLVSIGGEDNHPTEDTCIPVPLEHAHFTDEAPCMGSGFGGGGGFP